MFPDKQLIVLGNGFDMSAGLKSSYRDFFEWRQTDFGKESDETAWDFIFEYFRAINKNPVFWSDVEERMTEFLHKVLPKVEKALFIWKANKVVYEDSYRQATLDRLGVGQNEELAMLVRRLAEISGAKEDFEQAFQLVMNSGVRLPLSLGLDATSLDLPDGLYLNFFQKELKKFERIFMIYISNAIADNPNYQVAAKDWYEQVMNEHRTKNPSGALTNVITFNYTYSRANFYNESQVKSVHGDLLNNNVIFGIDSFALTDDAELNRLTPFTKTYRTLTLSSLGDEFDGVQPDLTVVKFFGHSLGRQDYSYFMSIFDAVDLYNGKTKLRFYYYDYDDNREKHEKETFDAVSRLMTVYGKSMDNQDHGKNILHKLQLEGRLSIVELKSRVQAKET